MKLELHQLDLKPEFSHLPNPQIRIEHFSETAQRAIELIGLGIFRRAVDTPEKCQLLDEQAAAAKDALQKPWENYQRLVDLFESVFRFEFQEYWKEGLCIRQGPKGPHDLQVVIAREKSPEEIERTSSFDGLKAILTRLNGRSGMPGPLGSLAEPLLFP